MTVVGFSRFIDNTPWTLAKTVPRWPHYYIVQQKLPTRKQRRAFRDLKKYIYLNGREGMFYDIAVMYYEFEGWLYWLSPIVRDFEGMYMVNKCLVEHSYESRLRDGLLPEGGFP